MKRIIFTRPDGGLSIMTPAEGFRLAMRVTVAGRTFTSSNPAPVDTFVGRWPVKDAAVDWAETEDEFIARVAAKDIPPGIAYQIVEAIPSDRNSRNEWKEADLTGQK